jgi:hypothetical protein
MTTEIYRTTTLPGAEVSIFHSSDSPSVTLSFGTVGAPAIVTFSAFVGPADLERLAADLLAAAQAIQMPRRAA